MILGTSNESQSRIRHKIPFQQTLNININTTTQQKPLACL
jgi:hypothetical protein